MEGAMVARYCGVESHFPVAAPCQTGTFVSDSHSRSHPCFTPQHTEK